MMNDGGWGMNDGGWRSNDGESAVFKDGLAVLLDQDFEEIAFGDGSVIMSRIGRVNTDIGERFIAGIYGAVGGVPRHIDNLTGTQWF